MTKETIVFQAKYGRKGEGVDQRVLDILSRISETWKAKEAHLTAEGQVERKDGEKLMFLDLRIYCEVPKDDN